MHVTACCLAHHTHTSTSNNLLLVYFQQAPYKLKDHPPTLQQAAGPSSTPPSLGASGYLAPLSETHIGLLQRQASIPAEVDARSPPEDRAGKAHAERDQDADAKVAAAEWAAGLSAPAELYAAVVEAAAVAKASAAADTPPARALVEQQAPTRAWKEDSLPALKLHGDLEARFTRAQVTLFNFQTGSKPLQVEVDGVQQRDLPVQEVFLRSKSFGQGRRVYINKKLSGIVTGMFHRGWRVFECGTLLLVLSRSDDRRMTLEECAVRGKIVCASIL